MRSTRVALPPASPWQSYGPSISLPILSFLTYRNWLSRNAPPYSQAPSHRPTFKHRFSLICLSAPACISSSRLLARHSYAQEAQKTIAREECLAAGREVVRRLASLSPVDGIFRVELESHKQARVVPYTRHGSYRLILTRLATSASSRGVADATSCGWLQPVRWANGSAKDETGPATKSQATDHDRLPSRRIR